MIPVLSGLGAALAAVLLHFAAVRLAPAGARPAPVLAAAVLVAAVSGFHWEGLAAAVYAGSLAGALMAAYFLLYIGVEHDSPTLALAGFIARQGEAGTPEDSIDAFVDAHPFARARIDKLLAQGILVRDDGRYRMRGRTGCLIDLVQLYRRVAGMDKASG